jgi:hypothetical protein
MVSLNQVYKVFDAISDKRQENVESMAIAGSSVLKFFDLIDREISDVDILINRDNESLVLFIKRLSKLFPVKDKDGYYYYDKKENHVRFMLHGHKVCVFIISDIEFFNDTKYVAGTAKRFSTIDSITYAKQVYIKNSKLGSKSREKHIKDLKHIERSVIMMIADVNQKIEKLRFISPISVKFDIKK